MATTRKRRVVAPEEGQPIATKKHKKIPPIKTALEQFAAHAACKECSDSCRDAHGPEGDAAADAAEDLQAGRVSPRLWQRRYDKLRDQVSELDIPEIKNVEITDADMQRESPELYDIHMDSYQNKRCAYVDREFHVRCKEASEPRGSDAKSRVDAAPLLCVRHRDHPRITAECKQSALYLRALAANTALRARDDKVVSFLIENCDKLSNLLSLVRFLRHFSPRQT